MPGISAHERVVTRVEPLQSPGGPLFDQREAALYLHKSERWMRRALSERSLPTVKIGRSVFVRRADLDDLIEAGFRPPANGTAPPGRAASPRARTKVPQSVPERTKGQSRATPLTPTQNGALWPPRRT